jgi:DNA-binding XRE family transcriptional regulator
MAISSRQGRRCPLHRLSEVRREEGLSQRAMARQLGLSLADLKSQEKATCGSA